MSLIWEGNCITVLGSFIVTITVIIAILISCYLTRSHNTSKMKFSWKSIISRIIAGNQTNAGSKAKKKGQREQTVKGDLDVIYFFLSGGHFCLVPDSPMLTYWASYIGQALHFYIEVNIEVILDWRVWEKK